MKHVSPSLFVLTVILLAAVRMVAAQNTDSLTLNEVMQRAVQNNPAVQRALEDARAAEARIGQSQSAQYPSITGDAAYTRIGPTPEIPVNGHPFQLAPADNFDLHIDGQYSLYDFGRTETQVRLSQSRALQSSHAVDAVRFSLAYQAARAFYGVLYLQQSIAVQDQQIAALNEHRRIAEKRVQTGAGISLDVLTTDVRVAAAQSQRIDLVNALEKQRTMLRELLGLPAGVPVNVRGELDLLAVSTNEDSLVAAARRQRIEMQLAQDAVRSAEIQHHLATRGDLPTVNAIAAMGFKNGYPADLNEWVANFAVGGRLSVPIFNGKRKHFQMQEAEANLNSQQAYVQSLERQIRSEIERATADVRAAVDKLQTSQVAIDRANAAVAVARSAYGYGTLTNVDLLDAETSVAVANLTRLQALYNYELARAALEQATGERVWEQP